MKNLLKLSLDFYPGHDSQAKTAPVSWCKTFLSIETTPEDWDYEGWGVYNCNKEILPEEKWEDMKENWEDKYEGNARGAAVSRSK